MVARVLGAAPILADAIIDQLAAPSDKAVNAGVSLVACLMDAAYVQSCILVLRSCHVHDCFP